MDEAVARQSRPPILDGLPGSISSRGTGEIYSLTGLRFVAALSVAASHYALSGNLKLFGLPFDIAPLGMQLFFTLSGFVIHYVYASSFNSSWRRAISDFSIARFSRLYPLFLFFFVYFILFKDLGRVVARPLIALSYLTLTSTWWYWTTDGHPMMTQDFGWSWSISTECFFYLAYALYLHKIYKIESIKDCALLLMTVLVFALFLIWVLWRNLGAFEALVLPWVGSRVTFGVDSNNSFVMWLIYTSPYFQIVNFILGCLVAQMYIIGNGTKNRRLWNESIFWLGVTWVVVFLFLYLKMSYDGVPSWGKISLFFPYLHFLHSNFLLVPGVVLITYSLAFGDSTGRRLLSSAYLVFLGEVSYSIYLAHPVVHSFVYFNQLSAFPVICLIIGLAMACIFATGLYLWIEVPSKRVLRKLLHRVTAVRQHSAAAVTTTDPS